MTTRRILIADSDPSPLELARSALAPLGLPIVLASSSARAIKTLLASDFAVAVMSYDIARAICESTQARQIPTLVTTAAGADVHRGYELGAIDVVVTPIAPDILCAKVAAIIAFQDRGDRLAGEQTRSERDREHRELERLNAMLAEQDRRKDSFLAILAHELRNPLAPLRTSIDLIMQRPGIPLSREMVAILDRQTNLLVRLVEDLLDVSRIKADKILLRPEPVSLADVIDIAVTTSRTAIEERRHVLAIHASSERVMVVADTIRLGQVINNVLNNAARYTRPGGRIDVDIDRDGDWAIVRVRDNGIGIPAELQETIFDLFTQERERSDGTAGLGLGLALSRRLVAMHHGTITARSEGRDRGSTFEIRVPIFGSPLAPAIRKRTEDCSTMPAQLRSEAVRVLLVDDNSDGRELVSTLLRLHGYEVLTAGDGLVGLEIIRTQQPEIAIVDLGLPKLDGFGVVEALRATVPAPRTRLIALTGYNRDSDRERSQRVGFHAHLVKPASAEVILTCISEQLVAAGA